MRLNFCASSDRIERLQRKKAFSKLDKTEQESIEAALRSIGDDIYDDREDFSEAVSVAFKEFDLKVKSPLKKAIILALSVADREAKACKDRSGAIEPDANLRDYYLVPLDENWEAYFEREIKPFVHDAWVDKKHVDKKDRKVGRVGYIINFEHHFYNYIPPRSPEEIWADIRKLESEISVLLTDMVMP